MASFNLWRFAASAALVLIATPVTLGCSPTEGGLEEKPLEHKIKYSDVVVSGKILQTIPDNNFPNGDVYSAQLEVHCIFKGGPLGSRIRINHAGAVPGMCHNYTLLQGNVYLVYLQRESNGDSYRPVYLPNPGDMEYTSEMLITCGVVVTFPNGNTRETNPFQCPVPDPDDAADCVALPTEPVPPTDEVPPPMPPDVETPPLPGQPKANQPKLDQPKPDQPKPDQPKPDQPKPDQPKPAENGASYESVVENNDNDENKGDKNGANLATFTSTLLTLTLAAMYLAL